MGLTAILFISHTTKLYCRCLLCGCGKKVRVYSIASGEVIHDLSGHTGIVTGITLRSENHLQALSCGFDRCIIRWDYTDGVLLQVHIHELLITYLCHVLAYF